MNARWKHRFVRAWRFLPLLVMSWCLALAHVAQAGCIAMM
jgi:hypothetical protein